MDPVVIQRIFDAYSSGKMSPEEVAAYEADVKSGTMQIPEGAALKGFEQETPILDSGVVQAAQSGKMTKEELSELSSDIKSGKVQLPEGVTEDTFVPKQAEKQLKDKTFGELAKEKAMEPIGQAETLLTLASSLGGQAAGGLAGLFRMAIDPTDPEAATELIRKVSDKLTYMPRTEYAQKTVSDIASLLEKPATVLETAREKLGGAVMDTTNSPALATAAYIAPDLALEVLGAGLTSGVSKLAKTAKAAKVAKGVEKALVEAAPSTDTLFATSRAIFKELDDIKAVVDPDHYKLLVNDIAEAARASGMDARVTPKAAGAIERLMETADNFPEGIPLSELDILRKVSKKVAASGDAAESSLGKLIVDNIDDFVDTATPAQLAVPEGINPSDIATKYRVARELWGRGRKSEILQNIFEDVANSKNTVGTLQSKFRSLLSNKKTRKLFTPEERSAMEKVVRGDKKTNIANVLGTFGAIEGGNVSIIRPAIGATVGASMFGAPGAVIVPVIGQVSKNLGKRLTANSAKFADAIIKAGNSGRQITERYLLFTPRAQRSASELAQLLMRPGVKLTNLPKSDLVMAAKELADARRLAIVGAATAELLPQLGQSEGQE